ncbi:hypothetical protein Sjap_006809 [Stephania japonica]|uniref:Uncharacterized protein n=1 Tax=Stephania japonica TaxID=461633 RepID=A0AAP0PN59_9MAGN
MAIIFEIENGVAHLGVGIGVFCPEDVERDMDLTELLVLEQCPLAVEPKHKVVVLVLSVGN